MSFYHLNPNRRGERLACRLEQLGDYRVLRRLPQPEELWCRSMPVSDKMMKLGIIDCETTGLDPERHKMIAATHDDDTDDPALVMGLAAETAYVGVLGSAPRIAARRKRLLKASLGARRIAALHAPIGAVRSGKAPWEVAVSVIAEIMQTRTDRSTCGLDDVERSAETGARKDHTTVRG